MKTIEQIWDSYFGEGDFDSTCFDQRHNVEKVFQVYAKQQALAFDVYRIEQGYILEHARNEYMKFGAAYMNEPRLSPEQLYAQFIEHQQKQP